jgi:hypothetical protein
MLLGGGMQFCKKRAPQEAKKQLGKNENRDEISILELTNLGIRTILSDRVASPGAGQSLLKTSQHGPLPLSEARINGFSDEGCVWYEHRSTAWCCCQ